MVSGQMMNGQSKLTSVMKKGLMDGYIYVYDNK